MDGVSHAFELGNQPSGVGFVVATAEPVGSEVVIGLVTLEHVVGRDQDRACDRDLCATHAAAASQACVLGGEVVLLVHPPH